MNINNDIKKYALKELPEDKRDYSYTLNFGALPIDDLPTHDFLVAVPLEIKEQDINYSSDFCASYSSAEAAEKEDLVVFVPEWSFAHAKALLVEKSGYSVLDAFGLNLRDVCISGVKGGFLPRLYDPFKCDTTERPDRKFIIDFRNWPKDLLLITKKYLKENFYAVDGPHDTFDNFRSTMWKNISERRAIITGCYFRSSWINSAGGIIPEVYEDGGTPHAMIFIGQKTINGKLYLVAQLSNSTSVGDNGLFYFSRDVINKEFTRFGAFTYKDLSPTYITDSNGVQIKNINKWNPLWIFKTLINFFKK